MGSSQYSFLDIVVLDEIRGRFANGDALVVLSPDLQEVLWANGPGARLFGHGEIGGIIGAAPKMGLPAERQISSTPGYPAIGRDRAIAVRITNGFTSRVVNLLASALVMPGGEQAILLAAPVDEEAAGDAGNKAERALEGFGEEGRFTALVDGDGKVVAASPDFAALAIGKETLRSLVREAEGRERLVKKRIPVRTLLMPAGLARLTDEPAMHLLVVVDDGEAQAAPTAEEAAAATPEPTTVSVEAQPVEAGAEIEAGPAASPTEPSDGEPSGDTAPHGPVDHWYFLHHGEEQPSPEEAASVADQDDKPAATATRPSPTLRKQELGTAPVKFVWRTGSDGRFTAISEEFAAALGEASAGVIGRTFGEVAQAFGFDADGGIAGLLERRDTWSGRSVLWPVAGMDMGVPVDLAALPVYGRDRNFQGFRGFGVARMADAVSIPAPEPAALPVEEAVPENAEPPAAEIAEAETTTEVSEGTAQEHPDPFQGEVPALAIAPKAERRYSDKVIRLAEHRPATPAEDGLSQTERNAFREIGARLRKENDRRDEAADSQDADEKPTEETDADKILPIARETFGKRDWLKVSAALAEQSATGSEDAPTEKDGAADELKADDIEEIAEAPETAAEDAASLDAGEDNALAAAAEDEAEAADRGEEPAISEPGEADLDAAGADESHASVPEAELADGREVAIPSAFAAPPAADERSAWAEPDLYPAILSKLPTPALVHSGDELHYANDEFLRLTGYPSLDAVRAAGGLGELFADPYDTEDEAGRKLCLRTASGETMPVEALLQSVPWKGGKALMLALRPVPKERQVTEPSGSAEIVPLPNTDAGSKADAEPADAPDARLEELRTIIDTATDGVVLISPEGTIRSISRPAEALFGFDSEDVTGKPFAALFAMESQRAAQDYLQGLSDHGVASVLNDGREVIGREAKGRFIPLFMTIGRLPGDTGFCAVLRDVTHWKRAEEELTQARSQAEIASSQKSEFLARISHEIRTPLNAIIGFSELMIDEKFGPVGNDRYRDYLRDINRSGNHVLDLVNDLLDISKIEAGEQEMNYEAVSLNDTLAETVAMMQPQANRERVIIRSSFPSRLPEVVADLRSVRQIALNLLSNAIRYTQAGGQVIVSTAYEASGDIVMRVRDTGVGMSQAEIEQAMKPFKRVNALKRPRGDGTGLGLPLTKAMVEANRARFAISSTPGEGTLVEVTFPSTRVLAD
jgi:PAS domain S-box-containing protein